MGNNGFIGDDFLLHSDVARELYHDHAAKMPIFDFHCHLPPDHIAENTLFGNLTDIWLRGDHYKWRAMRTNGVDETRITGSADDREKFQAWAETVPHTLGNPLYHWTHLELRRPFGIDDKVLNPDTAQSIWDDTRRMLAEPGFSTRGLLNYMDVRAVFTTDDPADSLEHHRAIADELAAQGGPAQNPVGAGDPARLNTLVRPSFRPDKALAVEKTAEFNDYMSSLGEAAGIDIKGYNDLKAALRARMDHFDALGCRVSDHALVTAVGAPDAESRAPKVFDTARRGNEITNGQAEAFKTALLLFLGREYARRGWVMQLHMGALRNNNTRMFEKLGKDSGFDSMADEPMAARLTRFLDMLDVTGELPKTIIYILNPRDNELIASTIGDFQDGSVPGKIQFGPAWWFNDQKYGMEWHMRALANMALLSRFVGMLTDSRSFLSYTRHEYFRRILADMIGSWVVNGEAPRDMKLLGSMVEDICWNNAVRYFDMQEVLHTP
jgi:glucuronate isomerase